MQFNSTDFLIFFPAVIAVYFILPRKCRSFWLLIASYYFYMSWNAKYAVLIGGSTLITYISALLMEKAKEQRTKKIELVACLLANLGILALFKYGNFAIETINMFLRFFHISTIDGRFHYLLPVGISFYTFQALGYMIDVYRGDVEAETNFPRYALFVSFFPQLVAGPIERSKNLLGQMRKVEEIALWNAHRIASGAILMVWGFFMKMVIADRVAIVVDTVFDKYYTFGSTSLILAAIGFTVQIYCDFGSYSLIAIGAAKIMGFDLMENFNTPYFARNIRDFWSRWHISLSTWFKDYLYIPLGGNRKGKVRKALNIMIVFLVSGLWHGASWNFVLWGGIHGLYQVIADALQKPRNWLVQKLQVNTKCASWKLLQMAGTFVLVVFAWIFFRAGSVTEAFAIIARMFSRPDPWTLFSGVIYFVGLDRMEMNILLWSLAALVLVDALKYRTQKTLDKILFEQNLWFRWLVIIGLLVVIFVFGEYGPNYDAQQFIYFQF